MHDMNTVNHICTEIIKNELNRDSQTCMFAGEKFYPAHMDAGMSETREEASGGFTAETDESLPHSVSLPTMEDLDTDQENSVPDTPGNKIYL